MEDYEVRLRSGRTRGSRGGRRQQGDCIASALTAQLMLCALLILCVFIIKKFDGALYEELKEQYAGMCGASSGIDLGGTFERVTGMDGGGENALDRAKRLVDDFLSAKPLTDEEAGQPPESETGVLARYDYLADEGLQGSGGLLPVSLSVDGGLMSAPPGSSLSPVYLSARVKPPVTGVITSDFAYRLHPVSNKSDFHTGMDVAAEEGRAILAALPGEVSEVGEDDVYGKYIVLKHATNLSTSYSHCSEIIAREGMAIRQGERIARVGQTGVATGPHLHFSVMVEGQFVDPKWVLSDSIKLVD